MNVENTYKKICLTVVDSTNNYLREHAKECTDAVTLVTAEHQTAGRGQRGNSWESEEGMNLVFSILIHPALPVRTIFSLSEACALAIRDALTEYVEGIVVKWPNDIYWHDRKIAGILIETSLTGKQIDEGIIGVGVNINQRCFRSDAPNPVSLAQIVGHEVEREEVMDKVMHHFMARYRALQDGELEVLHGCYMAAMWRREGLHPYRDEEGDFMASITAVEPSGHLILTDAEGKQRRYAFKEVSAVGRIKN